MLTNGKLQAIRERWEEATDGPWEFAVRRDPDDSLHWELQQENSPGAYVWGKSGPTAWDRDALVNAPTDIAALLMEVERLREVLSDPSWLVERVLEALQPNNPQPPPIDIPAVLRTFGGNHDPAPIGSWPQWQHIDP